MFVRPFAPVVNTATLLVSCISRELENYYYPNTRNTSDD